MMKRAWFRIMDSRVIATGNCRTEVCIWPKRIDFDESHLLLERMDQGSDGSHVNFDDRLF